MSIIWRDKFTFQFIIACLMGRVKSPQTFAAVMAEKYDLSIKSGYAIAGLPPIPFPSGKVDLLRIAILIGMLELVLLLIRLFIRAKKGSWDEHERIQGELAKKVEEFNGELSKLKDNYSDNIKDLSNVLSEDQGTAGDVGVTLLGDKDSGYFASVSEDKNDKCAKSFTVPLPFMSPDEFNNLQTELASGGPPPQLLKDEIKDSVLKVFDLNSSLIDTFNENAKRSLSEDISKVEDEKQKERMRIIPIIKRFVLNFAKKVNIFMILLMLPKIIKGMIRALTIPVTYHTAKIKDIKKQMTALSSASKTATGGATGGATGAITQSQAMSHQSIIADILNKNLRLASLDLARSKELLYSAPAKMKAVFKINPIKFFNFPFPSVPQVVLPALNFIKKRQNELAKTRSKVLEKRGALKGDQKKIDNVKALVDKAKAEAKQNPQSGIPTSPGKEPLLADVRHALEGILKCTQIPDKDKQMIIDSPDNLDAESLLDKQATINRVAIASLDKELDAVKDAQKNLQRLEVKYSKRSKDKFDLNIKLFNIALNVGLLGYWIGGVWPAAPGTATVIFPGVPPATLGIDVSFKGPKAFFVSLEKIFMAHAATVGGVWTVPAPTGVVITPWAGYY